MFRFWRFANEVLRVKWYCCCANGSPLVVGSSFRDCRFRELVGILAKELAEKFVLARILIIGRSALTFFLLPALLRRFLSGRRFLLIRILLFSRYQRLVFENRVESRDDKSRSVNFLLHDFRFAELLFDFFAQEKNKFLVPLWPGFIPRGGLELFLSGNQLHLKEKYGLSLSSMSDNKLRLTICYASFKAKIFRIK